MMKGLSLDVEKCSGCRACELACSMKHTGEYNPLNSRIHISIFHEKAFAIPVVCFQCNEPWCEKICPSGAIKTKTDEVKGIKVVEIAEDKCVGCKMCMLACPFGNMRFDGRHAVKCDLCEGDPECMRFCAKGALQFKEAEASVGRKWKSIAEKILASHYA
ncbi:MAG: 4Fe-4S dicluster domain-containing protein [Deltaproteobacteria bacterium]|nr:4Fe-4S dicluster domain-containing protein [Deltaproteobacteria bacterium]